MLQSGMFCHIVSQQGCPVCAAIRSGQLYRGGGLLLCRQSLGHAMELSCGYRVVIMWLSRDYRVVIVGVPRAAADDDG